MAHDKTKTDIVTLCGKDDCCPTVEFRSGMVILRGDKEGDGTVHLTQAQAEMLNAEIARRKTPRG
jgi:hypothetical protein